MESWNLDHKSKQIKIKYSKLLEIIIIIFFAFSILLISKYKNENFLRFLLLFDLLCCCLCFYFFILSCWSNYKVSFRQSTIFSIKKIKKNFLRNLHFNALVSIYIRLHFFFILTLRKSENITKKKVYFLFIFTNRLL